MAAKSSVLTGQKKGRHRAVRLRKHPNCFAGLRSVAAQGQESVLQAVLILITTGMFRQFSELAGRARTERYGPNDEPTPPLRVRFRDPQVPH